MKGHEEQLAVSAWQGCATILSDKTQKVSFKTKPDNAEVFVGAKSCMTPCSLALDKGKFGAQAIITKPGHDAQTVILATTFEP